MDIKAMIVLGLIGFVGMMIRNIPKNIFKLFMVKYEYAVTVSSDNRAVYKKVNDWVTNNVKSESLFRKASLTSMYENNNWIEIKALGLGVSYAFYNKVFYKINHSKLDKKEDEEYLLNVSMIGRNAKERFNEILNECTIINDDKTIIRHGFNTISIEPRRFDTIYCENDEIEIIKRRIDKFNSSRDLYNKLGIPYRLGILLYGDPGTGKTSIAKAIADYTGRSMLISSAFASVEDSINKASQGKNVVLIEEIDTMTKSRENPGVLDFDNGDKINTLLNSLDGVCTPEDLIIIATTNHYDELDPALTRAGRFDLKIELKHLTRNTAKRILISKGLNPDCGIENTIAPCDLQEEILRQIKIKQL